MLENMAGQLREANCTSKLQVGARGSTRSFGARDGSIGLGLTGEDSAEGFRWSREKEVANTRGSKFDGVAVEASRVGSLTAPTKLTDF